MAGTERWPDSEAVRKAIDGGRIPPVWLWAGPESFLKEELLDRLTSRVMEDEVRSLNWNRFHASEDDLDEILNLSRTLPMLSDRRVVFLEGIDGLGKAARSRLLEYVANPVPETVLVLSGERGDRDAFHRLLVASGAKPAVFWMQFEKEAVRWVQARFRDRGKTCDRRTALELVRSCGSGAGQQVPLRDLAPEVEKVILNLGEKKSGNPADLKVIGRRADEDLIYEIARRVTAQDLAGALRALDGALLFRKNSEIRVVATLTGRWLSICRVRDLRAAGRAETEVRKEAGVWFRDWPEVDRAARQWSRARLTEGLNALARADRSLKSSSKDSRVVLEETLVTLCCVSN